MFGYPPVCYSPIRQVPKFIHKSEERDPGAAKGSLWRHLCRGIYSNVKDGQKMMIRDLLDSHDDVAENFNDILLQFTNGRQLSKKHASGGDFLRVSKRGIKKREEDEENVDDKSRKKRRRKHRHKKHRNRNRIDMANTLNSASAQRKVAFEATVNANDTKSSINTESEEFESSFITSEESGASVASKRSFRPRESIHKMRRNATMIDFRNDMIKHKRATGIFRASTVLKNVPKISNDDLKRIQRSSKITSRRND